MGEAERGSQWPELWPARLGKPPYWLQSSEVGVYGKPQPEDFAVDYEHWKRVVTKSYVNGLGINWSTVRNVMDMRAVYGGYNFFLRYLPFLPASILSCFTFYCFGHGFVLFLQICCCFERHECVGHEHSGY